jgi:3-oxoacyl-[acyl-carrier protein] reductase
MSELGRLHGKIALVIGGSRGIGEAIVRRLTEEGATVLFTYLNSKDHASRLAAELASLGRVEAIQADSADADALRGAIAGAARRHGRIDCLVNNAAIALTGSIVDYLPENFDRMIRTNITPLFTAVQSVLPFMGEGGRIVAIGSTLATRTAFPGASVYAMTKAAVASLIRGFAIDLASRQITANTVQPGPTATDMSPDDGPRAEALRQNVPLRRLGRGHEIASLVAFLLSPDAAFITGAALTADGGLNA